MALFLTGSTGNLGAYIAAELLTKHRERLALLVRAKSTEEAEQRLWRAMQLHLDFPTFLDHLRSRIEIYRGDLTSPNLGLDAAAYEKLAKSTDSVIHCAASLNRKSDKSCFNVNLRGTLHVLRLAQSARDHHGLRRFSDISTVATAGKRNNEIVDEAHLIDWARSDYDPYARTKKFCEYMVHELLADVPTTVFRPSIVLGDSRFPETTQFDMVRAFVFLAQLPILPFRGEWRADIIPADYVSKAVVHIHQMEKPRYDSYNLSSGKDSLTYRQIVDCLRGPHLFVPILEKPFSWTVNALAATPRSWGLALPATLMKVFVPYLVFNTVFDNSRVVEELGESPVSFDRYAYDLFAFAKKHRFQYPYEPWPKAEVA